MKEPALYENDKTFVVLGWVPIPLPNEAIVKSVKQLFGPVLNIHNKKCKDGLLTGVRILTMNKNIVEQNPIPSYLKIEGHEIYVTCEGQKATCKHCGLTVHKQYECEQRLKIFHNCNLVEMMVLLRK